MRLCKRLSARLSFAWSGWLHHQHCATSPACYGKWSDADKHKRRFLCSLQVPEAEYDETVNKAAALGRAIDLAEQAFLDDE